VRVKHLNTEPNFGTPGERHRHAYTPGDDFYELLIQGHAGLCDADSVSMNARLVLLLANHIGDLRVLREAIAAARPGTAAAPAAQPEEPPP
jgi:hypothetical protein